MSRRLETLRTHDPIWRDHAFDRVTIDGRPGGEGQSKPLVSIVGTCYSPYESGPSLIMLADVAGEVFGPGFYGLHSCRPLARKPQGMLKEDGPVAPDSFWTRMHEQLRRETAEEFLEHFYGGMGIDEERDTIPAPPCESTCAEEETP